MVFLLEFNYNTLHQVANPNKVKVTGATNEGKAQHQNNLKVDCTVAGISAFTKNEHNLSQKIRSTCN